jgi:hypothetical protein
LSKEGIAMRIKAVRRYIAPQYPTRDYLLEHPELLRWIPKRWRKNRLVLGVLGMIVPLIVGCSTSEADDNEAKAPSTGIRVAPLFVHGNGRGAFGCVVVNPPVFLSEDEAQQVIRDEAKKAGIEFKDTQLTFTGVMTPVTNRFDFIAKENAAEEAGRQPKEKPQPPKPKTQKCDLSLDGYDEKHGIAYEFVSDDDFNCWETRKPGLSCTVSRYDFKATAEVLARGLAGVNDKKIVGFFYEPAAGPGKVSYPQKGATDADWKAFGEAREKSGKENGKEELRKQVRDFLAWLKAQGVI